MWRHKLPAARRDPGPRSEHQGRLRQVRLARQEDLCSPAPGDLGDVQVPGLHGQGGPRQQLRCQGAELLPGPLASMIHEPWGTWLSFLLVPVCAWDGTWTMDTGSVDRRLLSGAEAQNHRSQTTENEARKMRGAVP